MTEQLDFINKLFDTLKESSDNNSNTIQKLVEQQISLVSTVEKMPISDLKKLLEEHNKESADDIGQCEETVKTKSDIILDKVNELTTKVKLMIGVVVAAVALSGIVYYIARYNIDDKKLSKEVEQVIREEQSKEHHIIIEEIRKEIRKLHPEGYPGDSD